jgi:hypothetical protein
MGGVATHSRDGVMEETGYRLDGTPIWNVIEYLDTPPTDTRILVGQSFYDGLDSSGRESGFFEVCSRSTASDSPEDFCLKSPHGELLDQPLLGCHIGKDSQGFRLSRTTNLGNAWAAANRETIPHVEG